MAKRNFFQYLEVLSEMWGWLVIVLTFTSIGVGACFVLVYLLKGVPGIITGGIIGLVIMYVGIRIANRAYKGKGTIHVLSGIRATPELNNSDETAEADDTKS